MKKLLVTALLLAAPLAHSADKVIFACTTDNGKQVGVTEHAGKFRYQFGKPNKPELVFENKRTAVLKTNWAQESPYQWAKLRFQNGDYFYTLFESSTTHTLGQKTIFGLEVEHASTDTQKSQTLWCKCVDVNRLPK